MNNFYLYFNAFSLINIFILFVILFFRKNNSITNRILALIILDPGLNFLNNILSQSGLIFKVPYALFLFQGTAQFYAPLVMAYTCLMLGRKYKLFTGLNALALFVILLDAFYAFQFSLLSKDAQFEYINGLTTPGKYPPDMEVINNLFVLVMTAFFASALVKIYKHARLIKEVFSEDEKMKIHYVKHFVILVTVLNFGLTLTYALFDTPMVENFWLPLIINIIYVYVVYYAFRHSAILTHAEFCNLRENTSPLHRYEGYEETLCKEIKEITESQNRGKYKLTEIEMEENSKKLLSYMENEKPYLDPTLNLTKLSSALGVCSHNISLTLNIKFQQNFFDFINSYRVNEVKRMLNDLKQNRYTIDAIGFEAGFNSKTAFYRAFKKHTQLSPLEYCNTISGQ